MRLFIAEKPKMITLRCVVNCAVIRNLIMLHRHYLAKLFYVRYPRLLNLLA
jgi:hypothetical protein